MIRGRGKMDGLVRDVQVGIIPLPQQPPYGMGIDKDMHGDAMLRSGKSVCAVIK